ncbi:malate dehydrogenase protein [Stemphylium lycopersici]|nr:malate dehydrogenase protein [Stemphylium lycopersici]
MATPPPQGRIDAALLECAINVEALFKIPTLTRVSSANGGSTRRKAAPGQCGSLDEVETHRIALEIPAFDLKIARISAYRRHKPFIQLAESGKVECGRRGYPDALEPPPGLTNLACISPQGLMEEIWSGWWSVLTYMHMAAHACPCRPACLTAKREGYSRTYKFVQPPGLGSRGTAITSLDHSILARTRSHFLRLHKIPIFFSVHCAYSPLNSSSQYQSFANMLFTTITTSFLFAASATAAALPWPAKPHVYAPAQNLDKLAKLFPQSELASPENLELKYVVLGIGTQNYTCEASDDSVAPGTTGAFGKKKPKVYVEGHININSATLYDIGTKLNNDWMAKWKISSIAPLALSLHEWAPQLVDISLRAQGFQHVAGHHFFADVEGTNTPTFAFDKLSAPFPMTQVAKIGATAAPAHACPGKNGLPAVSWLYLQHKEGITQGGINTVYRVETAGGNKPDTCKGMPAAWEVKYAAQYWVYGPKQ